MSEPKILFERRGRIGIVRLNDNPTRNALARQLIAELIAVLDEADADKGLSCLVLASNGKAFCGGGNVKDMVEKIDPMFGGSPFEMQEGYRETIQALARRFMSLDIPVVAAVNGPAIGAGCDLACFCDIRIASTEAQFAESFIRVGLIPGDGGAWLLPRIVGFPRAVEMALTCRMVSAQEALEWGLATHVVDPHELEARALAMAETIASFPPIGVRLNKRLMRRAQEMTFNECLELSASYQSMVQSTADQLEAVAAMLEKRAPVFTGK